jgi:hypothetical protein
LPSQVKSSPPPDAALPDAELAEPEALDAALPDAELAEPEALDAALPEADPPSPSAPVPLLPQPAATSMARAAAAANAIRVFCTPILLMWCIAAPGARRVMLGNANHRRGAGAPQTAVHWVTIG